MTWRRVRKWKVKSAAWAGVVGALAVGPLAYWLLAGADRDAPVTPRGPALVVTSPDRGSAGADRHEALLATARSASQPAKARMRAVARLAALNGAEVASALEALARTKPTDEGGRLVTLAALNALWARGETRLVEEIAGGSSDPAVQSKALALARKR